MTSAMSIGTLAVFGFLDAFIGLLIAHRTTPSGT